MRAGAICLLPLVAACGGEASVTRIGPEGGTAQSLDQRLGLIVPPGALLGPVDIRIEIDTHPDDAIGDVLPTYRLSPEHVIFAAPVELVLSPPATDERLALLSVDLPAGSSHPFPLTVGTSTSLRVKALGFGCGPIGGQICSVDRETGQRFCWKDCGPFAHLDNGTCQPDCVADISCSYLWTCRLDTSDDCRLAPSRSCLGGLCGGPITEIDPETARAARPRPGQPGYLGPEDRRPYPCLGRLFTVSKAAP